MAKSIGSILPNGKSVKKFTTEVKASLDIPTASAAYGSNVSQDRRALEIARRDRDRRTAAGVEETGGQQQMPADEYWVAAYTGMAIDSNVSNLSKITDNPNIKTGIALETLSGIMGLPPIPDNIVDPPAIFDENEVSGGIRTYERGTVGLEYQERVLKRGQYLVLVPIELTPLMKDQLTLSLSGAGFGSGLINKIDTVTNAMNIMSYGFDSKPATKRYWRSVKAHAKAMLYCLGLNPFNTSNPGHIEYLKKYLPDHIVEAVVNDNNYVDIQNILSRGELAENEVKAFEKKMKEQSAGGSSAAKGDSLIAKGARWLSGYIAGKTGGSVIQQSEQTQEAKDSPVAAINAGGTEHLLKYIMNVNQDENIISTGGYTVYYCNGPIERNLSFQLEANPSELAKGSLLTGNQMVKKGFEAATSAIGNSVLGGNAGSDAVGEVKSQLSGMEGMATEWAYHNEGKVLGFKLYNNLYVPKVQSGGSTDFSWTVKIKEAAVGSTRFEAARVMYTWITLLPYVMQVTNPGTNLIIPTSALYCMAFSKGVINCPRAYISNLNLRFDPQQQTLYGAPTEIDIEMTIQPLFTVATTPDFNKFWAADRDKSHLIGAMWHPMSSMNIISTLCGQNTVFTKIPSGIFEFFIKGKVNTAVESVLGLHGNIGASIRDYFSAMRINKSGYVMF